MKKVVCQNCKQEYETEDSIQAANYSCPKCNVPFSDISLTPCPTTIPVPAAKSRMVYCILAVLFGQLGIHNIYSGHTARGIIKLLLLILLGWTIIIPLGVFICIIVELLTVTNDKHGVPFNDTLGIAGVILSIGIGLFCQFFFATILAAMLLPALSTARNRAREVHCVNNVKQISYGYVMYVSDYEAPPNEMSQLKPYFDGNLALFSCPSSADKSQPSYFLVTYPVPVEKMSKPSAVPIIIEKLGNHRKHVTVAFADGHVETVAVRSNSYTDLLNSFPNMDEQERTVLAKQLAQWDAEGPFLTK
ncbi:MAG: TM2 domain-containing protein [Lentisphaerae bacterium]|jgi:prepilin-type processing-associated H-X9-DG protein|nr:TM2 domain-containing protein [Lentisphaerota bacterium]